MKQFDFTKKEALLIQAAMDTETEYLIAKLVGAEKITIENWIFYTGFLGKYEEPVIISRTYQGLINASAATALALSYFKPAAVINQGIGGGHDRRFHRGDIVLGEKVVPMGAVIRSYAAEGDGISGTNFTPLPLEIFDRKQQCTRKVTEFPCDEKLLAIAKKVTATDWMRDGQTAKAMSGVIGSADEWNNELDRIALLRERYHTAVEDMESAAAAQLCYSYGIPFLGIRILSNSIVNGEEFDESVGVDGQKFIIDYVETYSQYLQQERFCDSM